MLVSKSRLALFHLCLKLNLSMVCSTSFLSGLMRILFGVRRFTQTVFEISYKFICIEVSNTKIRHDFADRVTERQLKNSGSNSTISRRLQIGRASCRERV